MELDPPEVIWGCGREASRVMSLSINQVVGFSLKELQGHHVQPCFTSQEEGPGCPETVRRTEKHGNQAAWPVITPQGLAATSIS